MTQKRIAEILKRNARMAVLIAIAVVLVAVMFIFYMGSQSSADEQAKLENQNKLAQNSLRQAQAQYDLTTLQGQEDSLKATSSFPSALPSVGLSAYIGGSADKFGVAIVSLSPKAASSETLAGKKYTRYDTVVEVSGEYDAINSFLSYLEGGPFLSLRIEGVSFKQDGGTTSGTFVVVLLTQ